MQILSLPFLFSGHLVKRRLDYRSFGLGSSNKQWHQVEVRVDKDTEQMFKDVYPNLASMLLFVCTEVEYGNGKFFAYKFLG